MQRNTPDLDALKAMSPGELKDYGDALSRMVAESTGELKAFNAVVVERFGRDAAAAYEAEDKSSGTVRVKLADGVVLRADTGKTVEWDQDKLMAIAAGMPWDAARHWFTFKVSMAEKRYDSLPPGDLLDRVTEARTVRYGTPRLVLERPADAAKKAA